MILEYSRDFHNYWGWLNSRYNIISPKPTVFWMDDLAPFFNRRYPFLQKKTYGIN